MAIQRNKKTQLAFWAEPELMSALEQYREEVAEEVGRVPTRGEILRISLQTMLGLSADSLSEHENSIAKAQQKRRLAETRAKRES